MAEATSIESKGSGELNSRLGPFSGLTNRSGDLLRGLAAALCLLFALPGAVVLAADAGGSLANDGLSNNGAAKWLAEQDVEFLKVDQAFALTTELGSDGALLARWEMPDGYYLYRHGFLFETRGTASQTLSEAQIPPGKAKQDEFFGEVEVYYHSASARLPLDGVRPAAADLPAEIGITYQGCADAGLCYPPETKWVALDAAALDSSAVSAAGSAGAAGAPSAPASAGTQEQKLAAVLADASRLWALGLFLLLGIGLAFTPCVLPMVPILSSIIVGEAEGLSRLRAFWLSLAYVLGMAITYAILGVLVGSFGASLNLQATLQSPPVLIVFSLVFVALSFSMFGFYELQLPQGLTNRLNSLNEGRAGGKYMSVFIMGALSSLVVSPCVSAPLAGALIYISTTGDAVFGGLALLALGLGMGVPLLILGSSGGHLLPRAGVWMDNVKAVFGVLLLGVAVWLLERVVPASVTLALWAALAVGAGVYLGALDFSPRQGFGQLWKASGALFFVYGVLLLIGAASGANDPLRPLNNLTAGVAPAAAGSAATVTAGHGDWVTVKGVEAFDAEHARGVARGVPVLLDLYADWCISCKVMERRVFPDPGVSAQLAQFHLIRADVTRNTEADQALMERYGLYGPPSMVFFAPDGTTISGFTVQGELDRDAMAAHLAQVLELASPETSLKVAINSLN